MGSGSKRQATTRQRGTDSTEQPDFRGCWWSPKRECRFCCRSKPTPSRFGANRSESTWFPYLRTEQISHKQTNIPNNKLLTSDAFQAQHLTFIATLLPLWRQQRERHSRDENRTFLRAKGWTVIHRSFCWSVEAIGHTMRQKGKVFPHLKKEMKETKFFSMREFK